MLEAYRQHVAERAALGIPPLPLSAQQTADLIELLKSPPAGEDAVLRDAVFLPGMALGLAVEQHGVKAIAGRREASFGGFLLFKFIP